MDELQKVLDQAKTILADIKEATLREQGVGFDELKSGLASDDPTVRDCARDRLFELQTHGVYGKICWPEGC